MLTLLPHSQHFISIVTYEWSNKLECFITLCWKGMQERKSLAFVPIRKLQRNGISVNTLTLGLYTQHFISFVSNESPQ
jgi:hypothetical protein